MIPYKFPNKFNKNNNLITKKLISYLQQTLQHMILKGIL